MTAEQRIESLPSFAFGDSAQLADRLGGLVVAGLKTGTCWVASEGDKDVRPGMRSIVLSGDGQPVAVIETVALEQIRFADVTIEHARLEGEGDLSLAFWRKAHGNYFTRNNQFAPDMLLYFETFRLIEVLDPEFAEQAAAHVAAEIAEAHSNGFTADIEISQ